MGNKHSDNSDVTVCGTYAALLSVTEVSLGSVLHSFHLPFTGHLLSLNQVFLLSRASCEAKKTGSPFLTGSVSFIAAALKSLSPIGKKLTPMLAISMQGILFNFGILLFGNNATGRIFGASLSSLWGFLQPLLIYYFIFGHALFQTFISIEKGLRTWVPMDIPSIWYVCIFAVGIKVLAAAFIALFSGRLSHSQLLRSIHTLTKSKIAQKPLSATPVKASYTRIAWLACKDLCVWPFAACVFLSTISFLWVEGANSSWIVWTVLRPIAAGFLLFFLIRILPLEKVAHYLENSSFSGLGKAFRVALNKINELYTQ